MGIRSPISTNPAMILGGLNTGVSALDMAHAYETVATGGDKIYNPILGDVDEGPIGIDSIENCGECEQRNITNKHPEEQRVLSPEVASDDRRTAARAGRRQLRHRHRGRDPRSRRRRQDRHHLELRRRLVRRLDTHDDRRGLGRLPEQRQADDHELHGSLWRAAPTRRSSSATSWSRRFRSWMTRLPTRPAQSRLRAPRMSLPPPLRTAPWLTLRHRRRQCRLRRPRPARRRRRPATTPTTPSTPATVVTTPATVVTTPATAITTPPASSVTPTVQTTTPPPAPSGGSTVGTNGGSGL